MVRTCALCECTSAGAAVTFRARRDICDWCEAELARTGYGWCAGCKRKVIAAEMAAGKARCKACERERNAPYLRDRRAYAKAWRANNAERVADYNRAYRQATREQRIAYSRARYWRDPEAARAQSRAAYRRSADKRRAWRRARYWERPEQERADSRRRALLRKLHTLRGER